MTAYFDLVGGASGDMVLAALVDAGCPLERVEAALRALGVGGWRLEATEVRRGGLRATWLRVETDPAVRFPNLDAMLRPVASSGLPGRVRTRATAVLRRLAAAEGGVHGVSAEAVHFHEVGALDTLVDVVGVAAALEALEVEAVHVSSFPLGGGLVRTAHGLLPVPGPATLELLRGFPVRPGEADGELVTPTGAAILTTLAAPGPAPVLCLGAVGYGAGSRELPVPNVLRVLLGESRAADRLPVETLAVLETTIDDMSPQLYEGVVDRLLEAGALDAWLAPVIMKRSRPGVVLSVLAAPDRAPELARLVFRETTTLGVRWQEVRRVALPRDLVRFQSALGPVTVKVARLGDQVVTVTPEFEEVRRLAGALGRPVREVLEEVRQEARRWLGEGGHVRPPGEPGR